MNGKIGLLLCIMCILTSLSSSFASNEFVMPMNDYGPVNVSGSFYVEDFSQILSIMESKEFKDWVAQNTTVDSDNFELELLKEDTKASNVVMFYNDTHKIYYALTTATDSNMVTKNNYKGSTLSQGNANRFKIVNKSGRTAHHVGITLYRFFGIVPIQVKAIDRYNLANNGELKYNPSPELTHVTIAINVEEKWPMDPRLDIYHLIIPLKTWDSATILKSKGYYLDFD